MVCEKSTSTRLACLLTLLFEVYLTCTRLRNERASWLARHPMSHTSQYISEESEMTQSPVKAIVNGATAEFNPKQSVRRRRRRRRRWLLLLLLLLLLLSNYLLIVKYH